MRSLLMLAAAIIVFGFVSTAQAGDSVCENGRCRLQPIRRVVTAPARIVHNAAHVVVERAAEVRCCRQQVRCCRKQVRQARRCCRLQLLRQRCCN